MIIQRVDVIERVAMNRVVRAPSSAPVDEADVEMQATLKDLEDKVTEGKKWSMKRILHYREADDGTLEFRIEWAGKWKTTWEPRTHIPEEPIYRYLVRRRKRDREAAQTDEPYWN